MTASMEPLRTERHLAALAVALGAQEVRGFSASEAPLVRDLPTVSRDLVRECRRQIQNGRDPLGEALCALRSPEERRPRGATYTPRPIVSAMLRWTATSGRKPVRVVDPGVGSARFLLAAGQRFPEAALIGIEIDPLAALIARANLAAASLTTRSEIVVDDFRNYRLPEQDGTTLFVGNPPYVRHHLIGPQWKGWLVRVARERGLDASQLAGLYVYFFLAVVGHARPGDYGAFITAAEWLDVNYGRVLREMFLGPLGGRAITLVEPTAQPFPDAATTATITCFEFGARPSSIRVRRVEKLDELGALEDGGRLIRRERLEAANRWTPLTRLQKKTPCGFVELGELCRVHRGQVTGANKVWIAGEHSSGLPDSVLFPSVTKARELFNANGLLLDPAPLRRVIDLPADLDELPPAGRRAVDAFLRRAVTLGAADGYIARMRKAWWAVGLREPAPILASYMARRPPAFVRNLADARHINIAHGIYPRETIPETALQTLTEYLGRSVGLGSGRTYAGGLTKFEPKEMERLFVPDLPMLNEPWSLPA
ncbi:MAG: N-6 DNA methylase [Acidobacteria bacterium]|nr:N-6 DNA methylase [Acidobacteriota bacterium]MBI3264780.1 N-6 DNA methylase [Acidobacteriota bacterium]